jgi:hypothetical protein
VQQLLAKGYTVHATCRDQGNGKAVAHLRALPHARERLRLVAADLLAPGSFHAAVAGCSAVIHTASPYVLECPRGEVRRARVCVGGAVCVCVGGGGGRGNGRGGGGGVSGCTAGAVDGCSTHVLLAHTPCAHNAQEERLLIRPAVAGTENVLAAVSATPSVRRVVLTSSTAAVFTDPGERGPGHKFSEADWNCSASLTRFPYFYSKTRAEQVCVRARGARQPRGWVQGRAAGLAAADARSRLNRTVHFSAAAARPRTSPGAPPPPPPAPAPPPP